MKHIFFTALIALASTFAMILDAQATEEPDFRITAQDGPIEVRQYASMIVAETQVTGAMRRAGNSGFRVLADYIFGNNTARQKIDMTAPVIREKSQKIAMTAPVLREANTDGEWKVSFVMPAEWTMDNLPVPNNPAVKLRSKTGEMLAAYAFNGAGSDRNFKIHQEQLSLWLSDNGYEMTGPFRYAGYSGPWVPTYAKRQEVLVPVNKP